MVFIYRETINKFRDYVSIANPKRSDIARSTGLSIRTVINVLSDDGYTPSVTTLERINEYTNNQLNKLEQLKGH